MKRRKFTSSLITGSVAPLFLSIPNHKKRKRVRRIKPPALKKGDTVGLIAPASAIKPGQLKTATRQLEAMGFKIKLGKYVNASHGNFAGTDQDRIDDFNGMLKDDEVKGIWCIRGGYGMARMLPNLSKNLLLKYPKLIIGYSDVTALHNYASLHGLVTIHGQVAGANFTSNVLTNLESILFGNITGKTIQPFKGALHYTITGGKASGKLTGGNLSLLSAAAGTPYIDSFKNKIVFIEDIGEKPYRIDRMLTQLIQSTDLSKANGIILGEFADCENDESDLKSFNLKQTLIDCLKPLSIPTCYGIPFGHVDQNLALPMLIEATMDADNITLRYDEEAVSV